MLSIQRFLYSDDGTVTDYSIEFNDYTTDEVALDFTKDEDYLYIATDLPFNHKYFMLDDLNAISSEATVEIWDGQDWNDALDVIDRSAVSGATLAKSGHIQWKTNKDNYWTREADSEDVTGISIEGIYNMYWARISLSETPTDPTSIKYIGNKFIDDTKLYKYYPDLNNTELLASFETSKTTWEDQELIASEAIVRDLKRNSIINSSNQLLNFDLFEETCAHKTAEIVFRGLGRGYNDDRIQAKDDYKNSLNITFFDVDTNADGNLSVREQKTSTGFMSR